MKIILGSGKTAHLIGDPHLGRKFEVGVPLTRRGDREARQFSKFTEELSQPCDYNIMVGDLLDNPYVSYGVVLQTATAYLKAAERHPDTVFIIMAGNHDLPRNISAIGAFDAFEKMLKGRFQNLQVWRSPRVIDDEIVIFPWQWGISATQQVLDVEPMIGACRTKVAIGHWDLMSYGGDDSHMAPTKELIDAGCGTIEHIYSGHYHTEGDYQVHGHTVHCTGSLEPYSHGEDPHGEVYVTLSLDEAMDGRDLSNKCVRVALLPGEELPTDLDCFALTAIKAADGDQEGTEMVSLGNFDWAAILQEKLAPLHPTVRAFISERLT